MFYLVAIYFYKKLYDFWSQYIYCKNKVKYLWYCYFLKQDCSNIDIIKEVTNVVIILKNKSIKDDF